MRLIPAKNKSFKERVALDTSEIVGDFLTAFQVRQGCFNFRLVIVLDLLNSKAEEFD